MRGSGILLPVASLPSPYGIGTLGRDAMQFVDFLHAAGQKYWQILPAGPTGYGDSPYQSFSAFAGNPYFVDLPALVSDGLLTQKELDDSGLGELEGNIDYAVQYRLRFPILRKAATRFDYGTPEYKAFLNANAEWLPDYALFMAIKGEQHQHGLAQWPDELRLRQPEAVKQAAQRLKPETDFWCFIQYLFYSQWSALKSYANRKGIEIIGDIPIYVSPDSSDLWASPELFQLDQKGFLCSVAGCPPDAFAADGQLWGNPLYDWDYHKKTDFAWWVRRLRHAGKIYDVVRIDHFRGIAGYYSIPAGSATAATGHWCVGPGRAFTDAIRKQLPDLKLIAEDLGYLTEDVRCLLAESGLPGMKIMQFAFDSRESGNYLPCFYTANSIAYTGTHDNTTTKAWIGEITKADLDFACRYLSTTPEKLVRRMVCETLACVSDTAIIPIQDWLELGEEARINRPSSTGSNWVWRLKKGELTQKLAEEILDLTQLYQRA